MGLLLRHGYATGRKHSEQPFKLRNVADHELVPVNADLEIAVFRQQ
ncbi:hypothetical protein [Phyllobacterium brassicacearum]|nr:hypothetical protein [Phyllobacterium brassicacearum]